ncbi:hypothetical protein [Halomicrobium urmianum]|uniref:hypothetical protein n=1 Tax=Halomicrobium urmianum TaxID=1586233 RepID=UPI001CD9A5D7|nr:hypothetical protein [Halomicrobium urmianum]
MAKDTEACGRCSMTVVVDAVEEKESGHDPFEGDRIEVDEREMQCASPDAWISRVSSRIDDAVTRLAWGR